MEEFGLEVQLGKCECYNPNTDSAHCPHRPAALPIGMLAAGSGAIGFGIPVGGVPVGDKVFVEAYLFERANKAVSKIQAVSTQPRDVHLPGLWTCFHYSLQSLFGY